MVETLPLDTLTRINHWLFNGYTGISSKTIASVFLGIDYKEASHPHDPADFKRCYDFLRVVPELRGRLDQVAEKHPTWKYLVAEWDRFEKLLERDMEKRGSGELYREMQRAIILAERECGYIHARGITVYPDAGREVREKYIEGSREYYDWLETGRFIISLEPGDPLSSSYSRSFVRNTDNSACVKLHNDFIKGPNDGQVLIVHGAREAVIDGQGNRLVPSQEFQHKRARYAMTIAPYPGRITVGDTLLTVSNPMQWSQQEAPAPAKTPKAAVKPRM